MHDKKVRGSPDVGEAVGGRGCVMLLVDRSKVRGRFVLWIAQALGLAKAPEGYRYSGQLDNILNEVRELRREASRNRRQM